MTPDEYCQQTAASSGSSFYYSFLFLPDQKRKALTALYAFCREVDDVVDECSDENIARTKLNWWRQDLYEAYHGTPQHPVNKAIAVYRQSFGLSYEYFQDIINGMEMDLDHKRYADFSSLSLYCYRVASAVGLLATEIFGYEDQLTLQYARDLGMALQLTNILRDVSEDLQRDRVYLPQDEMQRFGVSESDLRAGSMTEPVRALFAFQTERARQYYDCALSNLSDRDRYNQVSGLIMAGVYRATLDEISRQNYNVLGKRIKLSGWRKLLLAWTIARQEKKRYLHLQSAA